MHVASMRSVHGGREYTSVLLRQSFREGGKVKHRTLASLTALPATAIEALDRALRGETLVPAADGGLRILRSLPHGHVAAVLGMLRAQGLERAIDGRSSRMRDLAVAIIVPRLLAPALEAGHGTGPLCHDARRGARPGGRHRGRALWRARLAAGPPGGHRALPRAPPPLPAAWPCSTSRPPGSRAAAAHWRRTATPATTGRRAEAQFGLPDRCRGLPGGHRAFQGNVADPPTLEPQLAALRDRFGTRGARPRG